MNDMEDRISAEVVAIFRARSTSHHDVIARVDKITGKYYSSSTDAVIVRRYPRVSSSTIDVRYAYGPSSLRWNQKWNHIEFLHKAVKKRLSNQDGALERKSQKVNTTTIPLQSPDKVRTSRIKSKAKKTVEEKRLTREKQCLRISVKYSRMTRHLHWFPAFCRDDWWHLY